MPENLDSDFAEEGTPEPTGGSKKQGDSKGSKPVDFDAVMKRLDEIDKRTKALQGDKDRTVVSTQKEVASLKAKIEEIEKYKSKGLSTDEALEELELRDSIREMKRQLSTAGNSEFDPTQVLAQYELDENDPEVAQAIQGIRDPLKLENAALKVAFKRSMKKPDPSAAPATTGAPVTTDPAETVKRNYEAELKAMREQGRPSPVQIADLKAKYRKQGLEVW